MRTPLTIAALAFLSGCATRPPAPPPPDPMTEYLKNLPPFKYKQSTQLARLAADKCLAEHKTDPEKCYSAVHLAESSEQVEQSEYRIWADLYAPHAYATSADSFNRAYNSMSSGSSNAGPTLYIEPKPGTSVTTFSGGGWTSRQGGTFCTGGNGTATCY